CHLLHACSDVVLRPAFASERVGVLWRHYQQHIALHMALRMPEWFQSKTQTAGEPARGARRLISDLMRSLDRQRRHDALICGEPSLDVQGHPRAAFLPLREAHREAARPAMSRALRAARLRAAD